jgi:hypothetical protein
MATKASRRLNAGVRHEVGIKEVVDVLIHVENDVGKRRSLVFTAAADTGDGRRHWRRHWRLVYERKGTLEYLAQKYAGSFGGDLT